MAGWRTNLKDYYESVRKEFPVNPGAADNVSILVPLHMVPNSEMLAEALNKIAPIVVIPKSSQRDDKTYQAIRSRFAMADIEKLPKAKAMAQQLAAHEHEFSFRDALHDEELMREFIDTYVPAGNKILLLDIGGYYAPTLPKLLKNPKYADRIIGVSEGTANGVNGDTDTVGYRNIAEQLPIPVMTRAFDATKQPENLSVGLGCVDAVNAIKTRLTDSALTHTDKVGLIGFGPVGEHIARSLKSRGIDVLVYDTNPAALARAFMTGCKVTKDRDALLKNSDVLFLATGNKAITQEDLPKLKDYAFLACVTSADKEIGGFNNFSDMKHRDIMIDGRLANREFDVGGKKINLMMNGKAVNFWMGAGSAHSALYLALGSWIPHASKLLNDGDAMKAEVQKNLAAGIPNQVKEMDKATVTKVINLWLDHYGELVKDAPHRG
jgi:S-adenosylhomocysteine hydrolase